MYVTDDLLVFAYIFTVANAFQGVFIFVFHCCMNDKVGFHGYVVTNLRQKLKKKNGHMYQQGHAHITYKHLFTVPYCCMIDIVGFLGNG